MAAKSTIKRTDRFLVGEDATFRINLGELELTFEICEGGQEGASFVRLKSPEKISFRVEKPTHLEWADIIRHEARGLDPFDHARKALNSKPCRIWKKG